MYLLLIRTVIEFGHSMALFCLPSGVPDHIFLFPECYSASRMGINIRYDEELQNVAELSGVMDGTNYIDDCTLQKCRQIIPNPEEIQSHAAGDAFCYLKREFC